jgi:hypothetical protein
MNIKNLKKACLIHVHRVIEHNLKWIMVCCFLPCICMFQVEVLSKFCVQYHFKSRMSFIPFQENLGSVYALPICLTSRLIKICIIFSRFRCLVCHCVDGRAVSDILKYPSSFVFRAKQSKTNLNTLNRYSLK